MAVTGTFYGTTSGNIKSRITWKAAQSVEGNYSDITATLSYLKLNSTKTYGTWKGSITINGTAVSGSRYIEITNDGYTDALTATVRVTHDSYGKASFSVSAAGAISGTSLSSTTISATVTPDTIARASDISAADANIESAATVVVTRKNNAFSHSVAYAFGALQGYLDSSGMPVESEEKFTNTTLNFTLPESFYSQIPNAPSGKCTLTCRTWSGSTLIGTRQCSFTATAAQSRCAPLLEATVEDVEPVSLALTGDKNKLIRFVSTARCYVTATAQKGASIVQRLTDGGEVTGAYFDYPETERAEYHNYTKDSRGYQAWSNVFCELVPYLTLTGNVAVARTDPTSGNARLTMTGNCYKGSFGAAENTLQITCSTGTGEELVLEPQWNDDHSYSLDALLTGLDYTQTHQVSVTVTDAVGSVTKTVTVKPGIPVFDWGQGDFAFHVPVTLPQLNGLITDELFQYRGNCADADAAVKSGLYRLWDSSANVPITNGVMLVFAGVGTVLQLALSYNADERKLRSIWYGTAYSWQDL